MVKSAGIYSKLILIRLCRLLGLLVIIDINHTRLTIAIMNTVISRSSVLRDRKS